MSTFPSLLGGAPTPTAPGVPTLFGFNAMDGAALVFWNVPADDGNASLVGYTVTVRQTGTLLQTLTLGVTDFAVVSGLTNGLAYDIRVAARNTVGAGPSASVTVVPAPARANAAVTGPVLVAPSATPTGGENVKRDLEIDFTTKHLRFVEGGLVFATAGQAILQDVWLALGFFQGEWFLDLAVGVAYFRSILVKNPDLEKIRGIYRDKILSRLGVRSVLALHLAMDTTQRGLAVSFRINTDVGQLASARTLAIGG